MNKDTEVDINLRFIKDDNELCVNVGDIAHIVSMRIDNTFTGGVAVTVDHINDKYELVEIAISYFVHFELPKEDVSK